MIKYLKYLGEASRPKTLPASIGPFLITATNAMMVKRSFTIENSFYLLLIFMTVLLLQISSNLINDYADAFNGVDNQQRLGPRRVTVSGLLPPRIIKRTFFILMILAFLMGSYLSLKGGWVIFSLGIFSLLATYLYSAGPYPLAHYAMGELLSFIIFGPVYFFGVNYLFNGAYFKNEMIFFATIQGLLVSSIMSINNLRDRKTDLLANKKTVATLLSEEKARFIPVFIISLASLLIFMMGFWKYPLMMTVVLPYYGMTKIFTKIMKDPITLNFNQHLAQAAKYLLVCSFVISLGLLQKR